jgi:2,3-bisphosphoglycerate-independent phosphoglycerate mutase
MPNQPIQSASVSHTPSDTPPAAVIVASSIGLAWLQGHAAFNALLMRSQGEITPTAGPEAYCMQQQGLHAQKDWPVGAWRVAQHAPEQAGKTWFCATLMTQHAARDHVVVGDAALLPSDQADALITALAQHFSQENITFLHTPHGWCMHDPRLAADTCVRTTLPEDAHGMALSDVLPRAGSGQGEAARRLVAVMNEAQMLLHTHPLNQARELAGEAPVNALWLWGGGAGIAAWQALTQAPAMLMADSAEGQARIATWLAQTPTQAILLAHRPQLRSQHRTLIGAEVDNSHTDGEKAAQTTWIALSLTPRSWKNRLFSRKKTLVDYGLSPDSR